MKCCSIKICLRDQNIIMVKEDLRIISYNVRGLNNSKKRFAIFNYLKKSKCDIAFLQETYSSKNEELKWTQEWGGTGLFVHGTKHSKGVAILFRKSIDIDILSIKQDTQGRFLVLKCKINDEPFNLINIYAPNRENEQVKFVTDLLKVMALENINSIDNNIIGGDWNVVQDSTLDKIGGMDNIKHNSVEKIMELKNTFNLEDVWRLKHEGVKRYTWRQKTPRIHCRLDYFFISRQVLDYTVKADILPSILSDHSPILLVLKYLPEPSLGSGSWKFNTALLLEPEYVETLKEKLIDWIELYSNMVNENLKWEITKYEIRQFTIKFSKRRKRMQHNREIELEARLKVLEEAECHCNEQNYIEMDDLRAQLKDIEIEKANGTIIRSRAQWIEQGEKSTAYFFNLEKQNAIRKNIKKLNHEGKEETNQENILQIIKEYYTNIYSHHAVDLANTDLFTQPNIPKVSEIDKMSLDRPITLDECASVIKSFALNKSPGNDGLPIEFYLKFWTEIGPMLVKSYTYSVAEGLLTTSQRQAIISLLDKKGKDRLLIENWRPISLLNIDYKIFSKCLSERVKNVLEPLIHNTQTGFVKGRNISDGIRAILDILEETDLNKRAGLLLTIDFEKAFDSVSWDYLFKALKAYNFGNEIIKMIRLCYTDISSCVMNYKSTTGYFGIQRGVRQGDPLSPYLFILAIELMSIHVRHDESIHGLIYDNHEIKLLLYADDITAILHDEEDAKRLLLYIKKIETISGLKVNQSKSEGMWLGIKKKSNRKPLLIKWPPLIKILGISIGYNKQLQEETNFREKINKIKKKLNIWKQRDLTIYGKVLILKTFALSQLLYVASVFHVPDNIMKEVEALAYNFLWNGRQHKVKQRVVTQDYEHGGCKMIDLYEMNKVQKIKVVKKILSSTEGAWKYTMKTIIKKSDLPMFLKSNFIMPTYNITAFYLDVLRYWKEIKYKEISSVEEILQQCIWYNEKIKINQNVIYSKSFIDRGIINLFHIFNNTGSVMNFTELNLVYGIDRSMFMFYVGVIKAIPAEWKKKLKGKTKTDIGFKCLIDINGMPQDFLKIENKVIYSALVLKKLDRSKAHKRFTDQYGITEKEWKFIYSLSHNIKLSNKSKEINYKILHNYVATNRLLYKMKIIHSPRCNFCNLYEQTTQHLFCDCFVVKTFWFRVTEWLSKEYNTVTKIGLKDILFGHKQEDQNSLINTVISYAKLYINKCKFLELELTLNDFTNFFHIQHAI